MGRKRKEPSQDNPVTARESGAKKSANIYFNTITEKFLSAHPIIELSALEEPTLALYDLLWDERKKLTIQLDSLREELCVCFSKAKDQYEYNQELTEDDVIWYKEQIANCYANIHQLDQLREWSDDWNIQERVKEHLRDLAAHEHNLNQYQTICKTTLDNFNKKIQN